jgi:hypothetical protein
MARFAEGAQRIGSIIQIIELSPAPIASETHLELLEEIDSGSPCILAWHARLRIDSFKPHQRLLHDISQLIGGERAILFERDKRADAQHERRRSTARSIKLNRHASLPA